MTTFNRLFNEINREHWGLGTEKKGRQQSSAYRWAKSVRNLGRI